VLQRIVSAMADRAAKHINKNEIYLPYIWQSSSSPFISTPSLQWSVCAVSRKGWNLP